MKHSVQPPRKSLFCPATIDELRAAAAGASRSGMPLPPVELSSFNAVREYHPDDMTVTVEGGMKLSELQRHLAAHGQWLPVDPPPCRDWTIEEALAANASGPRRFGYGGLREHIIGMEAVIANGDLIHAGGKVVKNVAGFDIHRLWVGSRRRLGILTAATFRLRPKPPRMVAVNREYRSAGELSAAIQNIFASQLEPVAIEAYGGRVDDKESRFVLILIFEGGEESVEWQVSMLDGYGRIAASEPLEHEQDFWGCSTPHLTDSFPPARLGQWLDSCRPASWLARAGSGVVFFREPAVTPPPAEKKSGLLALEERVVRSFDPAGVWKFQVSP